MRKLFVLSAALLFAGFACLHAWAQGIPLTGAGGKAFASRGFVATATDFNGTNQDLTRGSDLTSNSDGPTGLFSVWFRKDAGDGTAQYFFSNSNNDVRIGINSSDQITGRFVGPNGPGSELFIWTATNTITASATWRNFMVTWTTNAASSNKVFQGYLDGTALTEGSRSDNFPAFSVNYTTANWYIGSSVSGSFTNGCVSEFYLALNQTLDLSVQANREKFRSAGGKPVSLGSDGSLPTGSQPSVYLKGPAASIGTNSGTGGNFTANNTPTACSTTPSD